MQHFSDWKNINFFSSLVLTAINVDKCSDSGSGSIILLWIRIQLDTSSLRLLDLSLSLSAKICVSSTWQIFAGHFAKASAATQEFASHVGKILSKRSINRSGSVHCTVHCSVYTLKFLGHQSNLIKHGLCLLSNSAIPMFCFIKYQHFILLKQIAINSAIVRFLLYKECTLLGNWYRTRTLNGSMASFDVNFCFKLHLWCQNLPT